MYQDMNLKLKNIVVVNANILNSKLVYNDNKFVNEFKAFMSKNYDR